MRSIKTFLLLSIGTISFAQDGQIDLTFGVDGYVQEDFYNSTT